MTIKSYEINGGILYVSKDSLSDIFVKSTNNISFGSIDKSKYDALRPMK